MAFIAIIVKPLFALGYGNKIVATAGRTYIKKISTSFTGFYLFAVNAFVSAFAAVSVVAVSIIVPLSVMVAVVMMVALHMIIAVSVVVVLVSVVVIIVRHGIKL